MDNLIQKRDKIFDCFFKTNIIFSNLTENERIQKSQEYFLEIFKTSGVDYNKPDEEGLNHVINILNSRIMLDGHETSKIIENISCLEDNGGTR